MTEEQTIVFAKIMGLMAWADGELHPEERKNAERQLTHLGLSSPESQRDYLDQSHSWNLLELARKIDGDLGAELLKRTYLVAQAAYGMAMTEEAILRKLAAHLYPGKPWNQIRRWLETFFDQEKQGLGITGVSHYL